MRNTIFIVLLSVILVSGSVVPATFADHVSAGSGIGAGLGGVNPVSYTHLTLPTILLV